jgi:hypothetical protein
MAKPFLPTTNKHLGTNQYFTLVKRTETIAWSGSGFWAKNVRYDEYSEGSDDLLGVSSRVHLSRLVQMIFGFN